MPNLTNICFQCSHMAKSKARLTKHIYDTHKKIDREKNATRPLCTICGKSFHSTGALGTHIKGTYLEPFSIGYQSIYMCIVLYIYLSVPLVYLSIYLSRCMYSLIQSIYLIIYLFRYA